MAYTQSEAQRARSARLVELGRQRSAATALRRFHAASARDDDAACARIAREFPHVLNYDERGNWVGSVANENGWTS